MAVAEPASRGSGIALRYRPGPPSMRVLSTIVASTNVTASVRRANSSPRSRGTRKTTAPIATPNRAATTPASGRAGRTGRPAVRRVAAAYTPAPKNAPWPKLKYPANPLRMLQLVASAIQWKTR